MSYILSLSTRTNAAHVYVDKTMDAWCDPSRWEVYPPGYEYLNINIWIVPGTYEDD